jgi:hypothetical protein
MGDLVIRLVLAVNKALDRVAVVVQDEAVLRQHTLCYCCNGRMDTYITGFKS